MKKILIASSLFLAGLAPALQGLAQQSTSINREAIKLSDLLAAVEKQFHVKFAYSPDVLPLNKMVTIQDRSSLDAVLKALSRELNITYVVTGNQVVLSKNTQGSLRQTRQIRGKVTDASDNTPLRGVTVSADASGKRVMTNAAGEYTLVAEDQDKALIFSHSGKQSKRVAIRAAGIVNVALEDDSQELEEVIITGYGSREKRESQVGSAVQIDARQLERKPVNRIDQMLDGLVPGLRWEVQSDDQSSSRPRYQTRIRGEASFAASNEPLWIIDGVPIYTGGPTNLIPGVQSSISPLSYINPNDIQSVTVLKDATATSIYGADGANGVILITTKKGATGRNTINYNFRTGVNVITDTKFQTLTGDEYRELAREAYKNAGLNPDNYPFDPAVDVANTDWYDEFYRQGLTTLHDLSFSGGNDKTRYYISGSYYKEKKTLIANNNERLSTRINLDQVVNKRLSLAFRVGGSYNKNTLFTPGRDYFTNRPNINPYNADGSFALFDAVTGNRFLNRLAEAAQNDNNQNTLALNSSVGAEVNIINGLQFTTTNGVDFYNIREDQYSSMKNWSGMDLNRVPVGYAYRGQTNFLKWVSINRLNFKRSFGKHGVEALLGTEASDGKRTSVSGSGSSFANDNIREVTYAPEVTQRANSSAEEESAFSVFSRVGYSWNNKYSVVGNYRRDGNSRFGTDVKWANFASIGGSWTISSEPFWDVKWIHFAKAKISYGSSGNSRIGNYAAKGLYSFGENYNYNGRPGTIMTTGENPVFSWETTNKLNGGISLGFFNRVNVDVEAYRNVTKNLIDNVDVSRSTGQTRISQNIGSVQNQGVELTVSSTNIDGRDFQWETNLLISHNRNKILELYNGNDKVLGDVIRREGDDANTFYLVRWVGVDPRDGGPLWLDARGNVTKIYNLENRVAVGSSNPDAFGSITNTFTYKNLSLSVLANYTIGGYAFSSLRRNAESDGIDIMTYNQSRNQLDRWREEGDLASTPKLIWGFSQSSSRNSTRFLHSRTHIRLQNISLNYRFDDRLLDRLRLKHLSAYAQADNIGLWTPYNDNSNRNTYKNSFSPYPMECVISLGVVAGL